MKVGKKEKKERIIFIYFGYLMEPIVKMWKFDLIFLVFIFKMFVIHEIPLHVSKSYFSGQKSENWPPKKIVVLTSHHYHTK
jgi:hypothetical protein